eukprot:4325716-Pleurochrysis_carterae.AAC.2
MNATAASTDSGKGDACTRSPAGMRDASIAWRSISASAACLRTSTLRMTERRSAMASPMDAVHGSSSTTAPAQRNGRRRG